MKIGVLAVQGDVTEHRAVLRRLGVDDAEVRVPDDLDALDGLIIPGGESTTIGRLAARYGLNERQQVEKRLGSLSGEFLVLARIPALGCTTV